MKTKWVDICITFLIFFSANLLHAQEELLKPRVGIIPMINTEKDEQYNPICETIDDTVILNINLLRRYTVSKTTRIDPFRDPQILRKYSEKKRLDNLVFGKLFLNMRGEIVLQMSVYDKIKDRITITTEEKAKNIFEVFDTANRLVNSVVSEFSKMHIGFGNIILENLGEHGYFSVFMDNEYIGENISEVKKILNGSHTIEVHQDRMFGHEVIYSEDIWVYEDTVSKVSFSIPYLLEKERVELERLEGTIKEFQDKKGEKQRVVRCFDEVLGLLEDVSYCFRLIEEHDKFRQMEVMYKLQLNWWEIEYNFNSPKQSTFNELLNIYESAENYIDPRSVQLKAMENANFLYNVIGANAVYDFSQGNMETGLKKYEQIAGMTDKIPATHYHLFEDEKKFTDDTIQKYIDKNFLFRAFSSLKLKKKLNKYYGYRLKGSDELFNKYNNVSEKELIVLTNPQGMKVYVNDKYHGRSPLRIKRLSDERVTVKAEDPWFHAESMDFKLTEERNFLFLCSTVTDRIKNHHAESIGQKSFKLSWNELPDAKSYTVQVDRRGGNFLEPKFEKSDLKKSMHVFKKSLEEGTKYLYRVQAINENNIRSVWSYSTEFQDRRLWSHPTGGKIFSSPAVGSNGTIYFGSDDHCLYAVGPDGAPLWALMAGGSIRSSPVLGPDGTIYFGSMDRYLYAVNPSGQLLWSFITGGSIQGSPAIGSDGTVYTGSDDGCLYAVHPDGSLKWMFKTGGSIITAPTVDSEGAVYIGSEDHTLYALAADGDLKWVFKTGGGIRTSSAVGPDNSICFGSDDHTFYALNSDGTIRWAFLTGDSIQSSPVIDSGGTIYFGSDDYCLYALHSDGEPKWVFSTKSCIRSSPYLDTEGTVYFSNTDKDIFALLPDGKLKWKYELQNQVLSSPRQSYSGNILIGSDDKRLYALISGEY